jgi:5-formyltetrahydrofolate cyclo-ligase
MTKAEQRQKAKALLSNVLSSDFDSWNISLSKNLNTFLRVENLLDKVIGGFAPIFHEPIWNLELEKEKEQEAALAFPCFDGPSGKMLFKISSFADLKKNLDFGAEILGPALKAELAVPEILLIPGLSFTLQGERLGRGKGFYDRYLENYRGIKVGLCFECQLSESLATEAHDQKMNFIITERNIYRIRSQTP